MKKIFKIPGVTFSLKRLLGITKIKQQIARKRVSQQQYMG